MLDTQGAGPEAASQRRYGAVMREVEAVNKAPAAGAPRVVPLTTPPSSKQTAGEAAQGAAAAVGGPSATLSHSALPATTSSDGSGVAAAAAAPLLTSSSVAASQAAATATLEQAVASLLPAGHPGGQAIARWLREDGVGSAVELTALLSARDKAAGKRVLVEHGVKEAWADALVQGFWRRLG